jgi:Kef-type K+ transport system membrane component KefB
MGLLALAVLLAVLLAPGEALAAGVSTQTAATFLAIGLLLVAAKTAGLIERIGQPAVLGELLIGVAIGNAYLFGMPALDPMVKAHLIDNPTLRFLADLGVVILLFQIGLESEIATMRKVGVPAFVVATIGVVAPFALGTWVVGPLLMPELSFNGHLFIGATLTATSVGITGRVFQDLNVLKSREAQIVLGAAVIDDVMGLIILAVVSAIVTAGSVDALDVAWITAKSFLFLAASLVLGLYAAPRFSALFSAIQTGTGMKVAVLIATCLTFAWAAWAIGLAPIVGAFAAGLVLDDVQFKGFAEPKLVRDLREATADMPAAQRARVEGVIAGHEKHGLQELMEPVGHLLVPIFFVYTGLQVRVETLFDTKILLVGLAITIVAFAGKLVAGLGAGPVRKWVVGWGMAPRGEVGLIFAVTGKALGVVPDDVFSMIIVVVILTTLFTPPILVGVIRKSGTTAA